MRWEDERYVRLYTRDTVDWLGLSFEAQGLFALLLRKVDRAGVLPLGKRGTRAVALAIGHPQRWDALATALDELVADGCIVLDGERLIIRNFLEAQEARQSDKSRQQKARELARAIIPMPVTKRDEMSQNVTESHTLSHDVTPSLAVPSCAVPSLAVPLNPSDSGSADAPPGGDVVPIQQSLVEAPPTTSPPAPKRPTGGQVDFHAWAMADRGKRLPPSAPRDEAPARHVWISLAELLRDHGRKSAEAGWLAFAAAQYPLEHGLPMALFAKQWPRWVQEAARQQATATGPPVRLRDVTRGVVRAEEQQHGSPGVKYAFD